MDYPTFIARRPEFSQVQAIYVNASLVDAAEQMDPTVWGAKFDQGQMWLAADLLTTSPYGGATRMVAGQGKSWYREQYDRLLESLCLGVMVGGGAPWV